jgi:hypothetical protein
MRIASSEMLHWMIRCLPRLPSFVQGVFSLLDERSHAVFCQAVEMRRPQNSSLYMVINGSDSNLTCVLGSTEATADFPDPDRLDHASMLVLAFSHAPNGPAVLRLRSS